MSGAAGYFNILFYLVGSSKVGGAGDAKHTLNTATLTQYVICQLPS